MEEFIQVSASIASVLIGGISILFFVGLVVNFAQAQLAGGTGDAIGYARAVQQTIAMVVLLAIAANADTIGSFITGLASPVTGAPGTAWLTAAWKGLARIVVSTVLGGTVVFTAVSVVFSALGSQASSTVGSARGMSTALLKIGVLLGGAILAIGSIVIANGILDKIL